MISSSRTEAEAETTFAPDTLPGRLPFYGAVCLISYWSLLLVLRAVALEALLHARPDGGRTLEVLLTGYITVGVGMLAEVAFFFLVTAVVLVTVRLFGDRPRARSAMSALGLAHAPLLLWVVVALIGSGLLTGNATAADVAELAGRGGASTMKALQLVSQALSILVAPELLHRMVGVRRVPAMVGCGVVAAALTALMLSTAG
jgi:hypothetical protein